MDFSEALSGVGDFLSAPRRLLWSTLSKPFGRDIQSGEDLTNALGLDNSNPWVKALGVGSEIVGDPLMYLPFGAAARGLTRLGGAGARALGLGASAAEAAGTASRLGKYADAAKTALGGSELIPGVQYTSVAREAPQAAEAGSSLLENITRPVKNFLADESSPGLNLNPGYKTYRDLFENTNIVKKLGPVTDPTELANMSSALRSGERMLPGNYDFGFIQPNPESVYGKPIGWRGKFVHSNPEDQFANQNLMKHINELVGPRGMARGEGLPVRGEFYTGGPAGVNKAGQFVEEMSPQAITNDKMKYLKEVLNHETGGHLATYQAIMQNKLNELPLIQRIAGTLMEPGTLSGANKGFRYSLGNALDEAYSQGLGRSKDPLQQLRYMADFMGVTRPNVSTKVGQKWARDLAKIRPEYAADFARTSPAAARLFETGIPTASAFLPYLAGATGAATGTALGAAGLNALINRLQTQNQQQPQIELKNY